MYVMHYIDPFNGKPFTHMHYDYSARDCDGRYDRSRVDVPNEGETFRQAWEWRVRHERRFLHSEGEAGYEGRARLTLADEMREAWDGEYDADGEFIDYQTGVFAYPVMSVYKDTDEGYSSYSWRACSGEHCITDKATFRDHTAESMGY